MATKKKTDSAINNVLKITGGFYLSMIVINMALRARNGAKALNTAYLKKPWEIWK